MGLLLGVMFVGMLIMFFMARMTQDKHLELLQEHITLQNELIRTTRQCNAVMQAVSDNADRIPKSVVQLIVDEYDRIQDATI